MNTTLIAMGISLLVVVGLVVNLGVLSLLSGAFHFLFASPKLEILKTENGENGFAFGFKWNNAREPAKFDKIQIRLFNPFNSPTQVDVSNEFAGKDSDFAVDVDFGQAFKGIINAQGLDNSTLQVQVVSTKNSVTHQFNMKTRKFLELYRAATMTASQFNEKFGYVATKPLYQTVQRSFIADPLPTSGKVLKIAANPEFAGDFAAQGGGDAAAATNFAVSKVWIEDGCIVCNACEGVIPEVFKVEDSGAIVLGGAPLDNGLAIQEAAEACPVEIIKFNKA